jgi:hypothetical protein
MGRYKVISGFEDAYNFYQSGQRMKIEQVYGILSAKWPLIKNGLPARLPHQNTAYLKAMIYLHNFCQDDRIAKGIDLHSEIDIENVLGPIDDDEDELTSNEKRTDGTRDVDLTTRKSWYDFITSARWSRP